MNFLIVIKNRNHLKKYALFCSALLKQNCSVRIFFEDYVQNNSANNFWAANGFFAAYVISATTITEHLALQSSPYDTVIFADLECFALYVETVKNLSPTSVILTDTQSKLSYQTIPFNSLVVDEKYLHRSFCFDDFNEYCDAFIVSSIKEKNELNSNEKLKIPALHIPLLGNWEDLTTVGFIEHPGIEKVIPEEKKTLLLGGDYSNSFELEGLIFFLEEVFPLLEDFISEKSITSMIVGNNIPYYLMKNDILWRESHVTEAIWRSSFCLVECRRCYEVPYLLLGEAVLQGVPSIVSPFTLLGYDMEKEKKVRTAFCSKTYAEKIRSVYHEIHDGTEIERNSHDEPEAPKTSYYNEILQLLSFINETKSDKARYSSNII